MAWDTIRKKFNYFISLFIFKLLYHFLNGLKHLKSFSLPVRPLIGAFLEKRYKITPGALIQIEGTTKKNRYRDLFNEVRKNCLENHLRILSYGCSIGHECNAVSNFFPQSEIWGYDINPLPIRIAKMENTNPNIIYSSNLNDLLNNKPFDIIFTLSVLCKWPEAESIDDISLLFPFERFDSIVDMLDRLLKPAGLLVIYNANYRFEDSNAFRGYSIIDSPCIKDWVSKFDRESRRISNRGRFIFIKR